MEQLGAGNRLDVEGNAVFGLACLQCNLLDRVRMRLLAYYD